VTYKKKAIFLDRDATLIEDGPFLSDPAKIRFLPGTIDGLKSFKELGFLLILITNQSGIGRGYFSEDKLTEIHRLLQHQLGKHTIALDAIYYCPHTPDDKCTCRKPEPGLFLKAVSEHAIDPLVSYSIGDKVEDAIAGKTVGCKTILLTKIFSNSMVSVDHVADDFGSAVGWIKKDLVQKDGEG